MDYILSENLNFSYSDESDPVLDDISLSVQPGEFVAVLGHNGSGKSTLAKHFNAILLPSGGKMYVRGMDTLDNSNLYAIRQSVGMVFQNPDNQIVATVVEEDVAFGPENLGVPPEEIRERVDSALKTVGMYEYRSRASHLLSGGQKQRIAIAGIIAMRPDCIVLDEPTAMLDPSGRAEVINTITELNQKYGITIILITHHMGEAARAKRVVVMNDGKIFMDGIPGEIFSKRDELLKIGLDVPQTVELLHMLNDSGLNLPVDALTVEECTDVLLNFLKTGL